MAYTLHEDLQLKNPKSVQYYPEEYDYPAYYNKIPEGKSNYPPVQNNAKKSKRVVPTINSASEKKCPIYVHQYNKIPNSSMYNNLSSKAMNKTPTEKTYTSKTKKSHNSHTTKSVLDQLEETYWATWKPNKENISNKPRRNKGTEERVNKNKAHGDASETLVKYFVSSEFDSSTASVSEDNHKENYRRKLEMVIHSQNIHNNQRYNQKQEAVKNTQEIQTDVYPLILSKIEEHIDDAQRPNKEKNQHNDSNTEVNTISSEEIVAEEKTNEVEVEKEKTDPEDETTVLKHTDSLIINKKKQSEIKEHFQQPKCIKLYKKPGVSTSFIRGGTYPLKSCLKREPVQRINFKLGAPGSPILVTTTSYSKKSRK